MNSLPITASPDPVPAAAGLYSTFIAWQQEPGSTAPSEIRVRYAPDGAALGPEMVASSPAQGPVDAADGIAAAGDVYGEAAVAWLQGAPGQSTVMVDQMYQAPGAFSAVKPLHYARTAQPLFSWTTPHGWGPMRYSLAVSGVTVAQTYATSAIPAAPLPDGPHSWQVFDANPAGQQSKTKIASVFIDTVPPRVKLRLPRLAQAGSKFGATVTYSDLPPLGEPPSDASGVAKILVKWGDGKSTQVRFRTHLASHFYRRTGRYQITVTVTDKAGNVTKLTTTVGVVRKVPKHVAQHTLIKGGPQPTGGASKRAAKRRAAQRSRRAMTAARARQRTTPGATTATATSTGPTGPTSR